MLESSEMFHGHLLSALSHISSLVSIMYLDIDLIIQTYIVFEKVYDNSMVYEIGSLYRNQPKRRLIYDEHSKLGSALEINFVEI